MKPVHHALSIQCYSGLLEFTITNNNGVDDDDDRRLSINNKISKGAGGVIMPNVDEVLKICVLRNVSILRARLYFRAARDSSQKGMTFI